MSIASYIKVIGRGRDGARSLDREQAFDLMSQVLDANLIPNSGAPFPAANQVRPRVPFRSSNYWALGLNAGFEIRY